MGYGTDSDTDFDFDPSPDLGSGFDWSGTETGDWGSFNDPSSGWGDFGGYGEGGSIDPYDKSTWGSSTPEKSVWDEIGSWLKTGLKAVGAIGNFSVGNAPVGALLTASIIADLSKKNWSNSQIASAIAQKTNTTPAQVTAAINDPTLSSAALQTQDPKITDVATAITQSITNEIQDKFSGGDTEGALKAAGMNLSWSERQQLKLNQISPQLQDKINSMSQAGNVNTAAGSTDTTTAQPTSTGGTAMTLDEQLKSLLGGTQTAGSGDEYFRNAMNEFTSLNTDIKFIHDMAELEGVSLSDEEKGFLETMRANATTNLTSAVNESTLDLAETEIARLVDRGVLQGNIGSETLSKIYEKAGKIVGEQSRNIESDVAKMGLGVLEQKKANQMGLWSQELTANIANVGAATDKWKSIGTLELGQEQQQQGWDANLINALTTMRGQDISLEGAKLGANTNLNLASQEMSAWKTSQDKQMWGNIGSVLIDKWL